VLAVALGVATVACCTLIARRVAARRAGRRRAEAFGRLALARAGWWRAVRSYGSEASAFAFRLSAYGSAALSCAQALASLERDGERTADWQGPPPQPVELLAGAERLGPPELWRRFDRAYETCYQLLHPADDCFELGEAALALALWVQEHRPAGDDAREWSGADAAFVHAVSAPCLAASAAESVFEHEGELRLDAKGLERRIDEEGSAQQRTLASLAAALIGCADEGPAVGELLSLEDTDLCHALEAVALARELRRVYPRQRPELLWMQAALADSGAQARTVESEEKGADE
jgi:hypothetical protein